MKEKLKKGDTVIITDGSFNILKVGSEGVFLGRTRSNVNGLKGMYEIVAPTDPKAEQAYGVEKRKKIALNWLNERQFRKK